VCTILELTEIYFLKWKFLLHILEVLPLNLDVLFLLKKFSKTKLAPNLVDKTLEGVRYGSLLRNVEFLAESCIKQNIE
jgi:hypothetical protein